LFAARSAGPTVQRLVLGGHLRHLRERAGITTEQAAASIRGSHSKISRMEHGRVGFKDRDITDLLTLYGVTIGEEREALL
jgi:transcriptional regulator with XRE-family HTH domain